jgi:hypothetical protein
MIGRLLPAVILVEHRQGYPNSTLYNGRLDYTEDLFQNPKLPQASPPRLRLG